MLHDVLQIKSEIILIIKPQLNFNFPFMRKYFFMAAKPAACIRQEVLKQHPQVRQRQNKAFSDECSVFPVENPHEKPHNK